MGHVQDRWYTSKSNPTTGRVERVKTAAHGSGMRYKVRYIDLDGAERSKAFPDRCKRDADTFLVDIEAAKREGRFVNAHAGKILFKVHAENWLKGQSTDPATRKAIRSRLRSRINPYFGARPLAAIKPSTVRDWLGVLDDARYSQNYRTVLFSIVSSILDSAVEDRLITTNPCKARTIKRPTSPASNIIIWPRERLDAIHAALPARFRITSILGAGCGLRLGEILGLSVDDIDPERMLVTVHRQIRLVAAQLVFSPPKGDKARTVPLAPGVLERITTHADTYTPASVALPWQHPDGDPHHATLLIADADSRLRGGDLFSKVIWQPAFTQAGLDYRKRADGIHALRHFYASVLLADGVSIKELADYLGHTDPGFTLRTYTHLVPSSHQRARDAVDGVFSPTTHGPDTA